MSTSAYNRTGMAVSEPVVHAPSSVYAGYKYRSNMGMIPSAEFCVKFDDFLSPVASNLPSGWTAAIIDTGATAVVDTTAGARGATGGIKIASDGTAEGVAIYGDKELQLTSSKKFFMEARVFTDNAAEVDLQFGLTDLTAVTNPEDLFTTTAANLVAFGLLASDATGYPSMLSDLSNSGTSAQAQTTKAVSDSTWAVLAIEWDGANLYGYVDGKQVLTWSGTVSTTVPSGVALAPFFAARTGATAGNISVFDYVRYSVER